MIEKGTRFPQPVLPENIVWFSIESTVNIYNQNTVVILMI